MTCPILIIEDELLIAESLAALLTDEMYHVLGIASDFAEADEYFHKFPKPALVISDINLKDGEYGVEVINRLRQDNDFEVIFLTIRSDLKTITDAQEANPFTYLLKPFTDNQVLVTVQMAAARIFKKQQLEKINLELSQRELEIAGLVAMGLSSREVAGKLCISTETVRTHRKNMLQRNNIRSFSQLVFLLNQS